MIRGILALAITGLTNAACAQDAPPADILKAIVSKLEAKPAPTGIVFRPAAAMPAPDNACPLQAFDMQLTRNDLPVRTYSVMLDAQADANRPQPKQFLAVVTRMQVDVDGSVRAYHPDDPEGTGVCTRRVAPDGEERPIGICALDKFSSGRIMLFRGADRLAKDDLVREWKDVWPLVRDRKLKPVDLRETYGADAPSGYYFFHWRARNLTAFFKRFIVPQTHDGYPCVHGMESRHPGYFVAATSLNGNAPARADGCSPARYIDAEQIPFLVLPKGGFGGVGIGDVMVARMKRDGVERTIYGIVADAGPAHQLGEGSAALNAALLGRTRPLMNMRDSWALDIEGSAVTTLVLGGTRDKFRGDYSRKNVEAVAKAEFTRWGGADPLARLDACVARAKVNRKCDAQRDRC